MQGAVFAERTVQAREHRRRGMCCKSRQQCGIRITDLDPYPGGGECIGDSAAGA